MAQGIDLDHKPDLQALAEAQLDHAVKQRFPMPVAREIVVGDEEALDTLNIVLADNPLQVVRRSESALAPLHVNDGAERALVRTASAQIGARQRSRGASDMLAWQDRRWLAFQWW